MKLKRISNCIWEKIFFWYIKEININLRIIKKGINISLKLNSLSMKLNCLLSYSNYFKFI